MANVMKARTMSADEKRWQAEDDARALARAAEIRADTKRHEAAAAHAKKEADDLHRRAQAMRSVAQPDTASKSKGRAPAASGSPLKKARGR